MTETKKIFFKENSNEYTHLQKNSKSCINPENKRFHSLLLVTKRRIAECR